MSTHHYKNLALKYLAKGIKTIPDKFGSKQPAVKAWNTTPVDEKQVLTWINSMRESNIAVLTGKVSGVIVLDFDCVNQTIIDLIEPILPPSPVSRVGAKGWARFYRYTGEQNYALKDNEGNIVFEVLSDDKKCTIPGSLHPSGMVYAWVENSLLDFDVSKLPILPPFLIPHIEDLIRVKMPNTNIQGNKIHNGRNDALSSLCGRLIAEKTPVEHAIQELLKFDKENHEPPLFTDPVEMLHTEPYTNALMFYGNHLTSVNSKRFKRNEEYEIPSPPFKEPLQGKLLVPQENRVNSKNLELLKLTKDVKLPEPVGTLRDIYHFIISNSHVPQPEFAFSAALVFVATLISRKFTLDGTAPNLYVLNVADSGCGKDAPQKALMSLFAKINADYLLGGDGFVSDASLTDHLSSNPVRLDIIDEASSLLKTVTKGGADYSKGMAEILCKLYTSSNTEYLGRFTAEGRKGACDRPNVNLLCSTTPTGIKESLTTQALDKGLLGRFLIFEGNPDTPAKRLQHINHIDKKALEKMSYWLNYSPVSDDEIKIGDRTQVVEAVEISDEANEMIDKIHTQFDEYRRAISNSKIKPIIARLSQQMTKIILISAAARADHEVPFVEALDVEFGYQTILFFLGKAFTFYDENITGSQVEEDLQYLLNKIPKEGINATELNKKTRKVSNRRKHLLMELLESEDISMDYIDGKKVYKKN